MADPVSILLPVGRLLFGDPRKGRDKDMQGNPLVIKTGPNAGTPTVDYTIGYAIRKGAEQHWAQTEWGVKIYNVGRSAFGDQTIQRRDFAWKIIDGDSQEFNQNNKRPCDDPNQRGHWILKPGTRIPPQIVGPQGGPLTGPDQEPYTGCFVQVYLGSVTDNGNTQKPGIYLNLAIVSFQAHGERIVSGPNAAAVGFGGQPLPAGASVTPIGGMPHPTPNVAGAPLPVPGFPGAAVPAQLPGAGVVPAPAGLPALPGQVAAPAALPVTPNPAFTTLPVVPTGAAPVPLPPANPAPAYSMTAAANGYTREQFHAQGWTDDQLLAGGFMLRAPL